MPQGEEFWNPYRLIPAREKVERSAPWTDERFRGQSGIIACTIENLTPLFIGAQASGAHHPPILRENRHRVIPGSSLKGMLRSLTEIVGGGCFVVSNDRHKAKVPVSPVPEQMKACSKVNQLCIACRMFGAMERGSKARVHKGKVSIGDAVIREDNVRVKLLQVLLANNGVRHEPFYRSPITGKLDGQSRKIYFHQPRRSESTPAIPHNIRDRAWNIEALLPGHHFTFDIQFNNLSDQELSLLLYILALEDQVEVCFGDDNIRLSGPMRHKIGNAKPLGLGSCHIQMNRLTFFAPPAERFTSMKGITDRVLENNALKNEIQQRIHKYISDQSPTMQALRKMMVWDEKDPRDFRYPDYHWFKDPLKSGTPLKVL